MREKLAEARAKFVEANNNYNDNLTRRNTLKTLVEKLESEREAKSLRIHYEYWVAAIIILVLQAVFEYNSLDDILAMLGVTINANILFRRQRKIREELANARKDLADAEKENDELYEELCQARELVHRISEEVEKYQTLEVDNSDILGPSLPESIEQFAPLSVDRPLIKQMTCHETR